MEKTVVQIILVIVCLAGLLADVVHSWGEYAPGAGYAKPFATQTPNETSKISASDLNITDITEEVECIKQLPLEQIELNVMLYECRTTAANRYRCNRFQDRYEYRLTVYRDAEQRIRKVISSRFALQGNDLLDLEEYYDAQGRLIFLTYGESVHRHGQAIPVEMHGTLYFRRAQLVKNRSYEFMPQGDSGIRQNTYWQPTELHVTVQSLQRMVNARLLPVMYDLSDALTEPTDERDVANMKQQYREVSDVYEMFQTLFR